MNLLDIQPNVVSTDLQEKHFLFYGAPGTRKTSVSALFPDAIFAATEIGYKLIPGVRAVNIDSWATFRTFVRELKKKEVKETFKTVVIDTTSKLTAMCEEYICNTNSVSSIRDIAWGQGWKMYQKEFASQINLIAQLGYSIVFIDHAKIKTLEDGTISHAATLMDNQCYPTINQLVDFTLYLQKEPKDGSNDPADVTVYAYSKLPSNMESKTRARHLAQRFEFNFENLTEEVKKAVLQIETVDHIPVTETYQNRYEQERESFESLKQRCIDMATALAQNEALVPVVQEKLNNALGGIRLSEATPDKYDALLALSTILVEIGE